LQYKNTYSTLILTLKLLIKNIGTMKIAISGATGFIGKKLVAHYEKEGATIHVLSRKNSLNANNFIRTFNLDLASCHSEKLIPFLDGCDVFYHCAGEIRNEAMMGAVHVQGSLRLIEAASNRIGRWVQLSSVGVYGRQCSGIVTEETPVNPMGVYEITKMQSDNLVMNAGERGAFEWSILRPSNVYGANMTNRSLFALIEMIRRHRFFFIGKPGASANYIHVDNVVNALLDCGRQSNANRQVLNLSDHRTIEEFVGTIAKELGINVPWLRVPESVLTQITNLLESLPKFPLTVARVEALTGRAVYSTDKIEKLLGYQHEVTMESGVTELTKYWLSSNA